MRLKAEPRQKPAIGERQVEKTIEQPVEQGPDDRREDQREDPAFLALQLQVGKHEERHGDWKAEEHDRREEAENPGARQERSASGRLVHGRFFRRLREQAPKELGEREEKKRHADHQRKELRFPWPVGGDEDAGSGDDEDAEREDQRSTVSHGARASAGCPSKDTQSPRARSRTAPSPRGASATRRRSAPPRCRDSSRRSCPAPARARTGHAASLQGSSGSPRRRTAA